MNRKSNPLSDRKRLGGYSILFVSLALAAAGLLVLAFDALENRYALKIDTSFNAITTKSAETDKVLNELDSDVHVYALFTPGEEDQVLIAILERYAAASRHFTFSVENLLQNPALIRNISSSLDDSTVTNDCLIIHGKQNDRTRILNMTDYITQAYDAQSGMFYVSGLNYEQRISEALLYVTAPDVPSIQLLGGHGELSREDIAAMENLLLNYNYALNPVDLLRGDELDASSPLMILSPVKDLTEDQLSKIDAFARAGGSLFITADFSMHEELPNFDSLYRSYGFIRKKGLVVAQEEEKESYYPSSPAVLMPYMEMAEPTATLITNKQTTLVLAGSAAFEEPQNINNLLVNYVLLRSGNAYLRDTSDQSNDIARRDTDETGTFPLALTAERSFDDGTRSKAFIIGNSSVFTDSWLYQNTYSSEFLLNLVSYLSPASRISLSIQPKTVIRPPLRVANPLLNGIAVAVLPVLMFSTALIVLLPRRRR